MASNLKDRLRRIRESGKTEGRTAPRPANGPDGALPEASGRNVSPAGRNVHAAVSGRDALLEAGWTDVAYTTLRRSSGRVLSLPVSLERKLRVLIPDLLSVPFETLDLDSVVFFDLETTGLSTGSGTVAFLAAFGRLEKSPPRPEAAPCPEATQCPEARVRLRITQYLLLDFPGESDFLEALLPEFESPGGPPLVVTYNGKSFDAQILTTRCLMNGLKPPEFIHADLLYPARRLWKTVLPNCSQSTIETHILGLDRTDDIGGAFAPDIWFEFLKTGKIDSLTGIADHNERDILGLATLFAALGIILRDPLANLDRFNFDLEALALRFRELPFGGYEDEARELLTEAASRNSPRAMFVLGRELVRGDAACRGRALLARLIHQDAYPLLRAAACRVLAIDAEHREKDPEKALEYVARGLDLEFTSVNLREDFLKRKERLLRERN